MKVYVVRHWCEASVLGVFDSEEKAMECIERNKPEKDAPSWDKEEFNVYRYEMNSEFYEEEIYRAR